MTTRNSEGGPGMSQFNFKTEELKMDNENLRKGGQSAGGDSQFNVVDLDL